MACSAINCSNNIKKGFRTFKFPSDHARRKQWVINCRRDNWQPTSNSRLCEIHFDNGQWESARLDGWKKLKPNAIPTLFNTQKFPPTFENKRKSIQELLVSIFERKITESDVAIKSDGSDREKLMNAQANNEQTSHEHTKAELLAQIQQLQEKVKLLEDNNKRLKLNLTETVTALQEENNQYESDIKTMKELMEQFLNADQIKSLEKEKVSSWSDETIQKALKLRSSLGVHGYKNLRHSNYPLPSYSTLNRRMQSMKYRQE